MSESYDAKLCEKTHDRVNEILDDHEKRLNGHSKRIDDLEKNDGIEVVYIKATEGKTYVNPKIDYQYNEAKNLGMKIGFYHFAGKNNVMEEYSHFISTISRYVQELKPVLDYEVGIPDINF